MFLLYWILNFLLIYLYIICLLICFCTNSCHLYFLNTKLLLEEFTVCKAVHVNYLHTFWQLLVNLEHLLTRCKLQVHNLQTILVNLGFWPCVKQFIQNLHPARKWKEVTCCHKLSLHFPCIVGKVTLSS